MMLDVFVTSRPSFSLAICLILWSSLWLNITIGRYILLILQTLPQPAQMHATYAQICSVTHPSSLQSEVMQIIKIPLLGSVHALL
jgi:hypothetical protein